MPSFKRPTAEEYAEFYETYVSLVPEDDVLAVLETQLSELAALRGSVAPAQETYRYQAGKWSVRELFGHLSDTERVFGFRAFCFSRGEQQPLPGFDEKSYAASARSDARSLDTLLAEWATLRQLNLSLLRGLDVDAWLRTGIANGSAVSVRALAFMMAGHVRHHLGVLASRYGIPAAP